MSGVPVDAPFNDRDVDHNAHGFCTICMQIPKVYTHYTATALFFFFGIKSIYDALVKENEVGAAS